MKASCQSADALSASAKSCEPPAQTSAETIVSSAATRASSCFTYDCGFPLNFMGVRMALSVGQGSNDGMAGSGVAHG